MKKLFLSALAIAAMVSCSKTENSEVASNEIQLSAAVTTTNTKAPIEAWDNTPVVFAKGEAAATYTEVWASTVTPGGRVLLNPSKKYHATNTYFLKGYAPAGTLNAGVVTFAGMDGTQDIIVSQELSGSQGAKFSEAAPFKFDHQLAQLNFKTVCTSEYGTGKNLTSIKVNGTALPETLTLSTGAITYATAPAAITSFAGTMAINTTATAIPFGAVMVEPGKAITIDVVTSAATHPGVPVLITGGGNAVKGTAYTITISFSGTDEITLTAEITPWIPGLGSADIQ